MQRLAICRVTHALYPGLIGGHAVFCRELSMRQADLGHRVEVLTTRRDQRPARELVKKRCGITRLAKIWVPWDSLGMQNPVLPSPSPPLCTSEVNVQFLSLPMFGPAREMAKAIYANVRRMQVCRFRRVTGAFGHATASLS
jgi:hypothetical protein